MPHCSGKCRTVYGGWRSGGGGGNSYAKGGCRCSHCVTWFRDWPSLHCPCCGRKVKRHMGRTVRRYIGA